MIHLLDARSQSDRIERVENLSMLTSLEMIMEPSRGGSDPIDLDHEARIAKLERTAVEHSQEFRLVMQHIDKSMENQRLEFAAMLEKALAGLRLELGAKIEASHRDLEAKIAAMEKKLWGAIAIMLTVQGIVLDLLGR